MPLPNDPEKIDDWKRKVSERTKYALARILRVENNKNIAPKDVIKAHACIHTTYKGTPNSDDVFKHNDIIATMKAMSIKHISYDELDEVSKYVTDQE